MTAGGQFWIDTTNMSETKHHLRHISLTQPKPELLNNILRFLLRPILIINGRFASPEIHVGGRYPLAPLEQLPKPIEQEENRHANVSCDEVRDVPISVREDLPAVREDDKGEHDQSGPCEVGLADTSEWQVGAVDALCFTGFLPLDRGDADADPGEEVCDGCDVEEPVEDCD